MTRRANCATSGRRPPFPFLRPAPAMSETSSAASRSVFRRRAFNAALGTGLIASVLAFGFFLPYWRHADQDVNLIYEALLALNGLPQEYFDHPGHAYFLALGEWFGLLDRAGLLPVHGFADMPSPADAAAFDAVWTGLAYAGRAFSVLVAVLLVFIFGALIRRIFNDARTAGVAAVAFAAGMGIMTQARQLRTEMISGGLTMAALLLALLAARRSGGRALVPLAAAAACAAVAATAKVQAVFAVAALPVVLWAFADKPADKRPAGAGAETAPGWGVAALWAVLFAAAAVPAWWLFSDGLAHWGDALRPYKPLAAGLSAVGVYQGAFIGWLALGALVFARLRGAPPVAAVQALLALGFGGAAGFCILYVRYNPQNVVAVVNFIEQMFVFSSWRHGAALGGEGQIASTSLLKLIVEGLGRTLAIRTVVLHPDNVPQTLLIEWFVLFAAFKTLRAGRRRETARILVPLLVAWGLEALFSLRGFQRAYAIYTDPFVVLSGVAALQAFPAYLEKPALRRRVYAGLALLVALAHVWPAVAERRRVDPSQHCDWLPQYMPRVEGFPFCPTPPGR